ncbi:hypothetical protein J6590_087243 [Homalodisca vitripennis]|nr:hypothetical protein J6590_087243 [Homalodisca vitripennis]
MAASSNTVCEQVQHSRTTSTITAVVLFTNVQHLIRMCKTPSPTSAVRSVTVLQTLSVNKFSTAELHPQSQL